MSYHYFLQPLTDIHLKSNLRYDASNNGSISRVKIFSLVGVIVFAARMHKLYQSDYSWRNQTGERNFCKKGGGSYQLQLIDNSF
jgi:hypothetical protein